MLKILKNLVIPQQFLWIILHTKLLWKEVNYPCW